MKLIGLIKEETIKSQAMKHYRDMGVSKQEAEEGFEELTNYIKKLPETVKLYRVIAVDNKDDINTNELGSHYSTSKRDLLDSHTYVTGSGDEYYIISVKAPKKLIDTKETIFNRILYPNEQEITLKNKGRGVEVVSIRKIKR